MWSRKRFRGRSRALGAALAAACLAVPAAAGAFDPAVEAQNFAKTSERYEYIVATPEFQARLQRQNVQDNADLAAIAASEAAAGSDARNFTGNVCFQHKQECAGDVRFYDWAASGFGIREEVMFGARSGATISGHVWATRAGPASRPLIVLTSGSVQAPEQLYWGLAAVMAKHGYVVLTYDVQGQGRSDTFGEGVDGQEGVPSQAGQPFYDGTEDALDFMLSKPSAPYDPRPSCGNANSGVGTDHSAKHGRRIDAGLNDAFNPYWERVDPSRVGLAGHSLGAAAVSYIGQLDPRVDAIAGWDNLRDPSSGSGNAPDCPSGSSPRPATIPLTKPALGMSNDYGIVATPNTSDPDPQEANGAFAAFKAAGVDSMQVNRRGGTHFEYSFIPGQTAPPLGLATLRGMDMVAWYTIAWFDKYVACAGDAACEADADRRLLTDRWRDDLREGQVDAAGDPNLYSFYLRSRFDLTAADGGERTCDDMRAGCASMGPDGLPPGYDFVADANRLDEDPSGGPGGGGGGAGPPACAIGRRGTDFDDTPETLPGSDAGDAIRAGGGNDRVRGGRGDDCLYGERGDDDVGGDEDDDRLEGGEGRDRLTGASGRDILRGGPGRDRLVGGAAADRLSGGGGPDRLRDARGRDSIRGGGGRDRIDVRGGGRQLVACGKGRDRVRADARDRAGQSCERVRVG